MMGLYSPKKRKPKKNKSKEQTSYVAVFKCAYLAGLLMMVLALTQMLLTMYYPISPYTNPISVYVRNITSFTAIGVLGLFLISWFAFASEEDEDVRKWNLFRFVAILTITISMIKGLYSLYVVYYQSFKGFYLISRYSIDGIAWIAVAVFIAVYYHHVLSRRHHAVNLKRYKIFCIVLTVIFSVETCFAILYVIIKYTPYYAVWIYYLATAVAWLMMSVFMSFYCGSSLVKLDERRHGREKIDADLEAALDKAAKG